MYKSIFIVILFISSYSLYSQISNDSCWSLLQADQYDILSENLKSDNFQTYFFRAKINRQKGQLEEGIQNIQKAISYYKTDNMSKEYASALEEYSVLSRLSMYKLSIPVEALHKSIHIRKKLGDSTKLATTYLYMGNTYINHDSIEGYVDSTLKYYQLASAYYTNSDAYQEAILEHNMGHLYVEQSEYQLAIKAYKNSGKLFKEAGLIEDYLWAELGIVDVYLSQNQIMQSQELLSSISEYEIIDSIPFLKKAVLKSYMDLYEMTGKYENALQLIDSLDLIDHDIFNAQQQEADAKYNNERLELRLAKEELETRQHRQTIIYLGIMITGLIVGFLVYSYVQAQKKKIKEQQLLLKQQEALQAERNRIASEMHDDLGGGLTTIRFVSQSVLRRTENEYEKERLQKIVNHSNQLVSNMSEIIWAMNSKFDTLESTVAYIRRYASTFLSDHNIPLEIIVEGDLNHQSLTSTERRNLLLVIKESLNNIVKHAQATHVKLEFKYKDNMVDITVEDNGIGLSSDNPYGNGLDNMKDRIKEIGGTIKYEKKPKGTSIKINLCLN